MISDADFIAAWRKVSSPKAVAEATGMSVRQVYQRRSDIEKKGTYLATIDTRGRESAYSPRLKFERRRSFEIKNGTVVIFSDPHFYPDHSKTAMRALLEIIGEFKPLAVLCGGDALDGTQISRWDPTRGWHKPPSIREQLDCMVEQMDAIKSRAGKGAITAMTLGNHDCRLSRYLAVNAPEVEDLPGTRLEDYIPAWPLSWTIELNNNTIIRHRNLQGMLHLQSLRAGCHYIHGHLHRLNVHAAPHYRGFSFSVDAGSFADGSSDAFDYHEDAPAHVQGFAVLTYRNGELLWPELCYVMGEKAYFRGEVVSS